MRIIAGELRGRRIKAPHGKATRPTLDRVREALFSMLGDLTDLAVIDCYAGSGAMGLEAASRGARRVICVESSRSACTVLQQNIDELGVGARVELVCRPLDAAVRQLESYGPFDLVLADPPWAVAQTAAETLVRVVGPHVSAGGRIVIGHAARSPVSLAEGRPWRLVECRSWGDSGLSFFRRD